MKLITKAFTYIKIPVGKHKVTTIKPSIYSRIKALVKRFIDYGF